MWLGWVLRLSLSSLRRQHFGVQGDGHQWGKLRQLGGGQCWRCQTFSSPLCRNRCPPSTKGERWGLCFVMGKEAGLSHVELKLVPSILGFVGGFPLLPVLSRLFSGSAGSLLAQMVGEQWEGVLDCPPLQRIQRALAGCSAQLSSGPCLGDPTSFMGAGPGGLRKPHRLRVGPGLSPTWPFGTGASSKGLKKRINCYVQTAP